MHPAHNPPTRMLHPHRKQLLCHPVDARAMRVQHPNPSVTRCMGQRRRPYPHASPTATVGTKPSAGSRCAAALQALGRLACCNTRLTWLLYTQAASPQCRGSIHVPAARALPAHPVTPFCVLRRSLQHARTLCGPVPTSQAGGMALRIVNDPFRFCSRKRTYVLVALSWLLGRCILSERTRTPFLENHLVQIPFPQRNLNLHARKGHSSTRV